MEKPSSVAPAPTLATLLDDSVANYGSLPVFTSKHGGCWVETTYVQFRGMVDRLRDGLATLGVEHGDRVGIIAGNREEWAATAFATYELGAAVVPMYPSQLAVEWAYIVGDSKIEVVVVANSAIAERLASLTAQTATLKHVVVIDEKEDAQGDKQKSSYAALLQCGAKSPHVRRLPGAEDVACVMYTSGTTGKPKGVVLSHRNILSNIESVRSIVDIGQGHRGLSFLPWAHAFAYTVELHLGIATGATIAIAESIDKLIDNFAEIRPTVLIAVPRVFLRVYSNVQKMLATRSASIRWLARVGLALARKANAGQQLRLFERLIRRLADVLIFSRVRQRVGGRLRFAISGASALPGEVAEFVDGIGIPVYEGYGLTEAAPVVASNYPGHRKFGTAGKPLPGVRVTIDTSVGEKNGQGEVVVHGPNIMRGYHNCPEETRTTLDPDGGLHTGDLGFLDDDGFLHITGRIKEQYKLLNGKYVSPAALEDRLKLSPFIAEIMVHGANRSCNIALIVPDWDYVRNWAELHAITDRSTSALVGNTVLRERMAKDIARLSEPFKHYEIVRSFVLLSEAFTQDSGMLTPSLKLKRRNVVERWSQEIERLYLEIDETE